MEAQQDGWTNEQINYLIDNYKFYTVPQLARDLNKTVTNIQSKVYHLKQDEPEKLSKRKQEFWTPKEDNYLKNNYQQMDAYKLAEAVNRSYSSVKNRLKRLHIDIERKQIEHKTDAKIQITKQDMETISSMLGDNEINDKISVLANWEEWQIKQVKAYKGVKTVDELVTEFDKSPELVQRLLNFVEREEKYKNNANMQTSLETISKFTKSEISYIKQYHKSQKSFDIATKLKKDVHDVLRMISIIKNKPHLLLPSFIPQIITAIPPTEPASFIEVERNTTNSHKPWTIAEEIDLVDYKNEGLSNEEISVKMNRTLDGITNRLHLLNYQLKYRKSKKTTKKAWLSSELDLLIKNFETKSVKELALLLNKSEFLVNSKIKEIKTLGLLKPIVQRDTKTKKWTSEDDQLLLENYGKLSTRILAEKLNCGVISLRSRLKRLKKINKNRMETFSKKSTKRTNYKKWTKKDDSFLLKYKDKMPLAILAESLSCTELAAKARMYKLDRTPIKENIVFVSEPVMEKPVSNRGKNFANKWTPQEDAILENSLRAGLSYRDISKLIDRNIKAIGMRVYSRKRNKTLPEIKPVSSFAQFPDLEVPKNTTQPILNSGGWTQEDEKYLFDNYNTFTPSELATHFGRSKKQVIQKYFSLRKKFEKNKGNLTTAKSGVKFGRIWTKEDDDFLKANTGVLDKKVIEQKLNRSPSSIRHRLLHLAKDGVSNEDSSSVNDIYLKHIAYVYEHIFSELDWGKFDRLFNITETTPLEQFKAQNKVIVGIVEEKMNQLGNPTVEPVVDRIPVSDFTEGKVEKSTEVIHIHKLDPALEQFLVANNIPEKKGFWQKLFGVE